MSGAYGLLALGLALALWGCATGRSAGLDQRSGGKARRLDLEPIHLSVDARGRLHATDAMSLFEAAGHQLAAKRYAEAISSYERLLQQFPQSALISPALYNMGLAEEARDRFDQAAARYAELIRRFGRTRNAVDAAFRLGACYAELRDWPRSAQVFGQVLRRADLGSADRIEALARKGLAEFRDGKHAEAERTLRAAQRLYEHVAPIERLDSDFFVGLAHYYLAGLAHLEFRQTPLDGVDAKLAQQLDEKARLLLVSQGRYIRAIKVRNPYWATAAGFQIGSIYREFYDAMMRTLPDFHKAAKANAKKTGIAARQAELQLRKAYLERLHRRIRPLLEKAIRVFEKNVVVAQRLGVRGAWVDKSRGQMTILKKLLVSSPEEAVRMMPAKPVTPEDEPGEAAPLDPASGDGSGPRRVL